MSRNLLPFLSTSSQNTHTYPRCSCNHSIWEEVQIKSNMLENVLENPYHLQCQHVLTHIISNLKHTGICTKTIWYYHSIRYWTLVCDIFRPPLLWTFCCSALYDRPNTARWYYQIHSPSCLKVSEPWLLNGCANNNIWFVDVTWILSYSSPYSHLIMSIFYVHKFNMFHICTLNDNPIYKIKAANSSMWIAFSTLFTTNIFQSLLQSYRVIYKTYMESQIFPLIEHTSTENTGCTLTTYSNASSFIFFKLNFIRF